MEIKEIKEKLFPVFEKEPKVKLVYLFGSQATGKTGPLSDFDFAVFIDERDSLKRFDVKLSLMADISSTLKTNEVDLVIINETDAPELKYNIIKEGVVIFEKEPYRILTETQILMEYFDFRHLLLKFNLTRG